MSDALNRVYLIGYLGADPELRMTQNGHAMLKLRLATTEVWFDKDGKKQERTTWHRATLWGKRAEGLARILCKGSKVFVDGRIENSSYEKDGQKHYSTDVIANDLIPCGGKMRPSASLGTDLGLPAMASHGPNGGFAKPAVPAAQDDIPF